MADEVNQTDPPHNRLPRTDWQILGELQLQVGSSPNGTINQWLTRILGPFHLPHAFVSKILNSIEDVVVRSLSLDVVEGQFEYLGIVFLAPAGVPSQKQTWGFFRVERISSNTQSENPKCYCVEYYLYLDRNSGEYG